MNKRMEHRPGASYQADCGCEFTYGEQVYEVGKPMTHPSGRPVLEVIHTRCKPCDRYNRKRSKKARMVYEQMFAGRADASSCQSLRESREYLRRVEEVMP